MRSRDVGLLGRGVLCAVALSVSALGCRPDGDFGFPRGPGETEDGRGAGAGESGSGTGSGTGNGSETGSGSGSETGSGSGTGSGTGSGSGSGAGPTASTGSAEEGAGGGETQPPPPDPGVTIQDITQGVVGEGVDVEVKGVIAMSRKWLVSKSNRTGSCLWGVFLSAPGLSVTEANSGILALSYGTPGVTDENGSVTCPDLEQTSAGDAFPDDVKPGDVLDVTGRTSYYRPGDCDDQPPAANATQVNQRQLANVTQVERVGTAPVPEPHTFSGDEITKLASPTDPEGESFHDAWGGVKVRLAGPLRPVLQGEEGSQTVVGAYGNISLEGSALRVGNKMYYVRGAEDACRKGPDYPKTDVEWTRIDGFSTLDYCTWSLQPANKCADFAPAGQDCMAGLVCE